MARPMNSAGSSSFRFEELPGGKAKGFEHKVNMNLHVFRTPAEK
jgi:hypothetical protein